MLSLIIIFLNWLRKLNHKNYTPLHIATKNNSKEVVELLIRNGADINAKDIIYQIIF